MSAAALVVLVVFRGGGGGAQAKPAAGTDTTSATTRTIGAMSGAGKYAAAGLDGIFHKHCPRRSPVPSDKYPDVCCKNGYHAVSHHACCPLGYELKDDRCSKRGSLGAGAVFALALLAFWRRRGRAAR